MRRRRSVLKNAAASSRVAILAAWLAVLLLCAVPVAAFAAPEAAGDDPAIAESLAEMLRDARTVVSNNQELINNPDIGDKGLTGKNILDEADATLQIAYGSRSGDDRSEIAAWPAAACDDGFNSSRCGRQSGDDQRQGHGVQGLHPGGVRTAGQRGVRTQRRGRRRDQGDRPAPNSCATARRARTAGRPRSSRQSCSRRTGRAAIRYSAMAEAKGRPAYRVMVPEYYAESCLTCHGSPKGEMDITGYPKEGGKAGDLGAVISITLYR